MFRKKGEFLGVYDYADEVYEVYPNPIEGAIIGVMKPNPTLRMYVGGKWECVVGEKGSDATIPDDLDVQSLLVGSPSVETQQGDVALSGDLNVGQDITARDIEARKAKFTGAVTMNDDLETHSDVRVGIDLTVQGDTYLDGDLYINGTNINELLNIE